MYIFPLILFIISSTIVVAPITDNPGQNNIESGTEIEDVGKLIYEGSSNQKKYPALKLIESSVQITSKSPLFQNEPFVFNNNAYLYLQAPMQKKSLYLCPAENQRDIHYLTENSNLIQGMQYCLFEKVYEGAEEMCINQVKPVLKAEINSQDSKKCSTSGRQLHAFGFHNCGIFELLHIRISEIRSQRQDLFSILGPRYDTVLEPVYHVCLDSTQKTVWTKHTVMVSKSEGVSIPSAIEPENLTEISTDPCTTDGVWFSSHRKFYEQENSGQIVMQMMVPKEHITPQVWKTATKHIINIAPLQSHLVPLMYAINDGIKKAAIKIKQLNLGLNMFFDSSPLKEKYDLDIYTSITTNQDVWCKLVYHPVRKQGIMIILHNIPQGSKIPKKYCHGIGMLGSNKTVSCNFPTWTEMKDPNLNKWSSNAYCCEATPDLMKQFFSMELEVTNILNLQKIIKGKPKNLNTFKLTGKEMKKLYGTKIDKIIYEL